jgi:hypothetical protein
MDKKQFKKIIEEFTLLKKQTDILDNALKTLDPEFGGLCLHRHEGLILDLLKSIMKDDGEWIDYWVYELEYGKKAKKNSVSVKDKNIPIKTINDLYNLLTIYNGNKD